MQLMNQADTGAVCFPCHPHGRVRLTAGARHGAHADHHYAVWKLGFQNECSLEIGPRNPTRTGKINGTGFSENTGRDTATKTQCVGRIRLHDHIPRRPDTQARCRVQPELQDCIHQHGNGRVGGGSIKQDTLSIRAVMGLSPRSIITFAKAGL